MPGRVESLREGEIGWVIFDHPERRNAISSNMWGELAEAIEVFGQDQAVRVVIMRGAGDQAFVSGADISQFENQPGRETQGGLGLDSDAAFRALASLEKPLIASIHGFCIGGGMAISLYADLRYAADDARFGIPAARLGVGYGFSGVESLSRVVGLPRAKEILFTARRYSAGEAQEMGLVHRVFEKDLLDSSVADLARDIARNAPLTVRAVKLASRELEREPAKRDMEVVEAGLRDCFESDDFKEGVAAFMAKRSPRFQGR
ncbi:MAG: enoyl-CoA hydratase [Myxococcota bacterium]|nr:enoyl-CoA hydratase [Myxococcota bacterium]